MYDSKYQTAIGNRESPTTVTSLAWETIDKPRGNLDKVGFLIAMCSERRKSLK